MEWFLWLLVTLAAFGGVLAALAWLASRARRRGVGGGVLGVLDEIYHPAAHQPRIEIRAQAQRMVPMPSPEDKPSEL